MIIIKLVRNLISLFDNFQQKKIINFFKKKISPNEKIIFFDVGAHHGETVKLFHKNFKKAKFYCFEASPLNFESLKKNIKLFKLTNFFEINNFALGNKNCDGFINQIEESSSSTINDFNLESLYLKRKLKILNLQKNNFYKKVPIKIKTLDSFIEEKNIGKIDILKIDTEGFEYNVVKGIEKNHNIIRFIYFEHHYDNAILKGYKFRDINALLLKYGFNNVYKSKMYFRKSFEYIYLNKKDLCN